MHRRFKRFDSGASTTGNSTTSPDEKTDIETKFLDLIQNEDIETLRDFSKDSSQKLELSQNWDLMRKSAKEIISLENIALLK